MSENDKYRVIPTGCYVCGKPIESGGYRCDRCEEEHAEMSEKARRFRNDA